MGAVLAVFLAVLSTLVLPVPEELTLLGAGWLAHSGALPLWAAWLASWSAIVAGDTATYSIGRSFLPALLRTRLGSRIVSEELRGWGEQLVHDHGFRAIVLGRFLVALRGPVYLAIGASKYPALRFLLINSAVGTVEVAMLVGLGYLFGHSTQVEREARWLEIAVALFMALILIAPPLFKRRLLRKRKQA